MSALDALFLKRGASAKYRAHPVGNGYPVRGYHDAPPGSRPPVTLGKGEKLDAQVTVRVRQFDLTDAAQLKEYTELRDKIANRLYFQIDRRPWTCPTTGSMKMYMEWAEPEYLPPKAAVPTPATEYTPPEGVAPVKPTPGF